MKRLIGVFLICAIALSARAASGEWLTDFPAAKKQAKEENKRVLMLFTGSDWCVYCIKWDKEVFSKSEFQDYAKTNFVKVLVDFPNKKPLPKAQQRANDSLLDKFDVDEYPCVVVLDSKAKKLGSIKYTEGGPSALIAKLEKIKPGK